VLSPLSFFDAWSCHSMLIENNADLKKHTLSVPGHNQLVSFFCNVCSSSFMGYQFCYIKPAPSLSLFTKLPVELPLNCMYSLAHDIFQLIPGPLIASTVNKIARDLLKINADHKSINVLVCVQSPSKTPPQTTCILNKFNLQKWAIH
jgi:hypothetical protein